MVLQLLDITNPGAGWATGPHLSFQHKTVSSCQQNQSKPGLPFISSATTSLMRWAAQFSCNHCDLLRLRCLHLPQLTTPFTDQEPVLAVAFLDVCPQGISAVSKIVSSRAWRAIKASCSHLRSFIWMAFHGSATVHAKRYCQWVLTLQLSEHAHSRIMGLSASDRMPPTHSTIQVHCCNTESVLAGPAR